MSVRWGVVERRAALRRAERDGLDLLVVGGGITGAGIARDAASRGLRVLVVERDDFATGTSSRSSKMIHGGLRYLAQGALGITREACRERDRLARLDPHLVRRIPFLFASYEGGRYRPWQVRAALLAYAALANFRRSARFRMLSPDRVTAYSRDLTREGLRCAGQFWDGQADDARLVIEVLKSARALGAEAVNHTELTEFERGDDGRIAAARVRDRLESTSFRLRAHVFVNAAGPSVERVRGLDESAHLPELRPAKGVHLVIPRGRIHCEGAVTFEARDGRQLFLCPYDDVALIGTTDTFTDELDEPVVTIEEVHYLLSAAQDAFPGAGLTTNDIRSVFAGVRPLVADADASCPPSEVSREHQILESRSGLLTVAGGKLTTHRSMGQRVVDLALRHLPRDRRRAAGPSRTARLPIRGDRSERADLERELRQRHPISARSAEHLVSAWGDAAPMLLAEASPEQRRPIGNSRYLYAEIPWSARTECPASLCDLLERRVRLALFAEGQGLPQLARLAQTAGEALGWDAERTQAEAAAYATSVQRQYQIVVPGVQDAA